MRMLEQFGTLNVHVLAGIGKAAVRAYIMRKVHAGNEISASQGQVGTGAVQESAQAVVAADQMLEREITGALAHAERALQARE